MFVSDPVWFKIIYPEILFGGHIERLKFCFVLKSLLKQAIDVFMLFYDQSGTIVV